MIENNQETELHSNNIVSVLAGMLIGGLAGAVTMLLLAPQSGKRTRIQTQEKGIELRDRATGAVEEPWTRYVWKRGLEKEPEFKFRKKVSNYAIELLE